MQTKKKPHFLALSVFFTLLAVIAAGCSCEDTEYAAATACQKLVDAVNVASTSCSLGTQTDIDVCQFSSADCVSFSGCSPKPDVDGCVGFIKGLGCTAIETRTYADFASCVGVLANIRTSCETGGDSSSSDWD